MPVALENHMYKYISDTVLLWTVFMFKERQKPNFNACKIMQCIFNTEIIPQLLSTFISVSPHIMLNRQLLKLSWVREKNITSINFPYWK